MWQLLLLGLRRYLVLFVQTLAAPLERGRRLSGALLLLLVFPLLLIVQLLHWLGFLLDEILFRGYRRIEVEAPLFVIGPPRTGTTFLHQTLAADPGFSTFSLWECLFGLSVTAKKIGRGLGWLDRRAGGPFARIGRRLGNATRGPMDDIHPLSLSEPEEDFLCLMPFAACFLLLVPYPNADWLWQIARFDVDLEASERQAMMRWYRRCIQKHLYVFGPDKQFLSKNASFSGLSHTLLEAFPDARILVTWRDPVATVPSQLSSLRPGLKVFGFSGVSEPFRDRLVDLTLFYYEHIASAESRCPDRVTTILNDDLRADPGNAISSAMAIIGLDVRDELASALAALPASDSRTASAHSYTPEEFGLSAELIRSRFGVVYARAESA